MIVNGDAAMAIASGTTSAVCSPMGASWPTPGPPVEWRAVGGCARSAHGPPLNGVHARAFG